MRKRLVLMKLGGSLITDKKTPLTFRDQHVKRIAKELNQLNKAGQTDFIIGTGAGSFGHFTAHEYGLRAGAQTADQRYGACLTHNAVQRLSNLVAEEFTSERVPVFTVSPSSLFVSRDKIITDTYMESLHGLIGSGIIPIIHGDMIVDTAQGLSIFSTEKILQVCLQELRAHYEDVVVIYLQDVEGVLDEAGNVIPQLAHSDEVTVHRSHVHDVTGGIIGKVESARSAAREADEVYLASGKIPFVIRNILAGKTVGTRIIS